MSIHTRFAFRLLAACATRNRALPHVVARTMFVLALLAAPAQAQVWVSENGNDSNNCFSQQTACNTLQAGLDKLIPGHIGVLNVLPGNYLGMKINKSVHVIVHGGRL